MAGLQMSSELSTYC